MDEFMKDRYGADELTTAMGIAGMALALIGNLTSLGALLWAGLALAVIALARAFSKNHAARIRENEGYRALVSRIPLVGSLMAGQQAASAGVASDLKRQARTARTMWRDRKTKAFMKCPTCGTTLAVPKGKGKLIVTCPKCHTKLEAHS